MKKFKKGDHIIIVSGKDKGKKTEIIKVLPKSNMVIAKGVNIVKKHMKPAGDKPGGIVEFEKPLNPAKFMILDSSGKPTRVGFKLDKKSKVRISKKTGKSL